MELNSQPLGSRAQPGESPPKGNSLLTLMVCCLLPLLMFAAIFAPGFYAARRQGQLQGCKINLRDLSGALEAYAHDHAGRYPKGLEDLMGGGYLKSLPTCPAAAAMTYQDYHAATSPDAYSVSCSGDNHQRVYQSRKQPTANYPRLTSSQGLQEP